MSYFKEREAITLKKLEQVRANLPPIAHRFFLGIAQRTSPLTRLNYAYDLRMFFNFLSENVEHIHGMRIIDIKEHQVESIVEQDIELFMEWLAREHGNSDQAIMRKVATLRSFFKYMFKMKMISKNILPNVDMPKIRTNAIERLEPNEVKRLLSEVGHLRDYTILLTLLSTGIRVSELVGLNIGDIDLKNKTMRITRKGGEGAILYLSDELQEGLEYWILTLDEKDLDPDEPLFKNHHKRRLGVRAIQIMVKENAEAITPLKKITPHKLRSTYGTTVYRKTGDIYIVADLLGHKDVNTTKKHYAAISEDRRKEIAKNINLFED